MVKFLRTILSREASPRKGLLPLEWVVLGYLVVTLAAALLPPARDGHLGPMVLGRVRILAITAALWGVYRLWPCRLTLFARAGTQLALLGWWYPDTYEINRVYPNLDHVFAAWEQGIFHCQPALLFSQAMPWRFLGELMDLGYASYYPMIALVVAFYFLFRYGEFERACFVLVASFLAYFLVYAFLPVAGPTYYYEAVGLGPISRGEFPNVHDHFNYVMDCLPSPGYRDGLFYRMVEEAKAAGERPTAAFPSSHVGIGTVLVLLARHSGNRPLLLTLLPFYVLLCLATVYIQAHYVIDAVAGLLTGAALYLAMMACSKRMKTGRGPLARARK